MRKNPFGQIAQPSQIDWVSIADDGVCFGPVVRGDHWLRRGEAGPNSQQKRPQQPCPQAPDGRATGGSDRPLMIRASPQFFPHPFVAPLSPGLSKDSGNLARRSVSVLELGPIRHNGIKADRTPPAEVHSTAPRSARPTKLTAADPDAPRAIRSVAAMCDSPRIGTPTHVPTRRALGDLLW